MIRPVKKISNLVPIRTALITVSDKGGLDLLVINIVDLCPEIMIYSSGGTFKAIGDILGKKVSAKHLMEVSEYTKLPETEGGLVKTLHHKLFLGYLTETFCEGHQEDLKREGAVPIDLLVCNLYPFKETIRKKGIAMEEARGNIDVGGPSALRAAAKNWHRVMTLPLPHPAYYSGFISGLAKYKGRTTLEMRYNAFQTTFSVLAGYDLSIASYINSVSFKDAKKGYTIV